MTNCVLLTLLMVRTAYAHVMVVVYVNSAYCAHAVYIHCVLEILFHVYTNVYNTVL